MTAETDLPGFARAVNLASAGLGAKALTVSDDFFAAVGRMLADAAPAFDPDKFDDNGKYMDGWESRRRRGPGHDDAVVRLAAPGIIRGVDIDTAFFTGNFPTAARLEAANLAGDPDANTQWTEIVAMTPLGASAHHFVATASEAVWTHVRLHIYPDGGVARLRVFGEPHLDRQALAGKTIDLASGLNGGRIVTYSDAHYSGFRRLLSPGRGVNMGDGWETRRRRTPGNDWMIIALGARGVIEAIEVDTAHFKGNFPESCSILGGDMPAGAEMFDATITTAAMFWPELLPRQPLTADAIHAFPKVQPIGPVTHIRVNIFPDGGLSRLRVFGRLAD